MIAASNGDEQWIRLGIGNLRKFRQDQSLQFAAAMQ
jgi:hypothetical protein